MTGIVSECHSILERNRFSEAYIIIITGNNRRVEFIDSYEVDERIKNHKVRILYRKEKGQKIIDNIRILD